VREKETIQVAFRVTETEAATMRRLIARAEALSQLPPGTVTMASFARTATVDYMARQLDEMRRTPGAPRGPTIWERIRDSRDLFDQEPAQPPKKGREP
jgi:hypothetical protein